jgi:hypothetical protein
VLVSMRPCSEAAGTQEQPQLEWHIEAGQVVDRVVLNARDVMNAEPAIFDQAVDPVDPRRARIVRLQSAADGVAAVAFSGS